MRPKRDFVALLMLGFTALILSACAQEQTQTPEDVGAHRMLDTQLFAPENQEAVLAAIARLKSDNADPTDFYVGPMVHVSKSIRELRLYHKAAFAGPPVVGNPGGQSRTMIYDVDRKQIVGERWWQ